MFSDTAAAPKHKLLPDDACRSLTIIRCKRRRQYRRRQTRGILNQPLNRTRSRHAKAGIINWRGEIDAAGLLSFFYRRGASLEPGGPTQGFEPKGWPHAAVAIK
jgi:hypothetical protein